MIWFKKYSIQEVRKWMSGDNVLKHMDIQFTSLGDDYLEGSIPVDHRTVQPFGILHGGSSCLLAETLGSVASGLVIDPEKEFAVGSSLTANYLRRATAGRVTGTAKPIHLGRTKHVWDVQIFNDTDKIIAKCELTCAVHPAGDKR